MEKIILMFPQSTVPRLLRKRCNMSGMQRRDHCELSIAVRMLGRYYYLDRSIHCEWLIITRRRKR
jgi:hypothetical protein